MSDAAFRLMRLALGTVSEIQMRPAERAVQEWERLERFVHREKERAKMIEEADKMREDNVGHFAVLANVDARLKLLEKK